MALNLAKVDMELNSKVRSTKGTYYTSLRGSDGCLDGVRTGKGSGKIKKAHH